MTSIRTLLARVKRQILKKPFLKDKRYPPYWFDKMLGDREAFLVQIGSNDGKTGDPLNQLLNKNKKWNALFVEPVPYLFDRLKNNYSDGSRYKCENVAINEGDKLIFYWVDPKAKEELDDLPFWFDQLGSFDRQHIINELDGKLEPFIQSKTLEGITLKTLFERNSVETIDLLHIDTEGYDWKILSQLDLASFKPKFILYEVNHLSELELTSSYQYLNEHYALFSIGIDVLAVSKHLLKENLCDMSNYLNQIEVNFSK